MLDISSACLMSEESVRTPSRLEKRPAMLRPSLGRLSCRASAPATSNSPRSNSCCTIRGHKGCGTVLFLSKRTGRGSSMVTGSVSSPGLGVCLLPPQDKGACLLPPKDKGACLLPPKDKGVCLLLPQDKEAFLLPPKDKGVCLLPPKEKGVCLRSRREGEGQECWRVCHEAQYMITDSSKIPPSLALSQSPHYLFYFIRTHPPAVVCVTLPRTQTHTHTHSVRHPPHKRASL
jgi:hypothetical protein